MTPALFPELHPAFTPQEAVVEANRCLFCFDAPCTAACPTHIDVPRFIKKIASGNLRGSSLTILEANILGLSCSRVCPVEVLCEGNCVMHRYNKQPIEIGRLQRHAMDHFYATGARLPLPAVEPQPQRIACIGAGPASLACAAELRRHGFPVTIFEARDVLGGLNTYGVAEYKFTPKDSQKEVEFIRSLGVEFRVAQVPDVSQLERDFTAIFLGLGLGPTEKLDIPGQDQPHVIDAIQFIANYKLGPNPRVGNQVVVIGGGNTAIDAAIAAKRLGARQVTLAYRRTEADMSAFAFEYEHAKQEGVTFEFQAIPLEIGPTQIKFQTLTVPCDMAIIAIGQSKLVPANTGIELDHGRIRVNPQTGQTSNPKYYAGGDCVSGGREVVDAVAEGKRAGRAIAECFHG